jgi:hypothetical protein
MSKCSPIFMKLSYFLKLYSHKKASVLNAYCTRSVFLKAMANGQIAYPKHPSNEYNFCILKTGQKVLELSSLLLYVYINTYIQGNTIEQTCVSNGYMRRMQYDHEKRGYLPSASFDGLPKFRPHTTKKLSHIIYTFLSERTLPTVNYPTSELICNIC